MPFGRQLNLVELDKLRVDDLVRGQNAAAFELMGPSQQGDPSEPQVLAVGWARASRLEEKLTAGRESGATHVALEPAASPRTAFILACYSYHEHEGHMAGCPHPQPPIGLDERCPVRGCAAV